MPQRERDTYLIQSVENALAVLEALGDEEEDVRISHLSQRLGMNKTRVFRLLATFENHGYVEREHESGKYRLGLSAYEIGQKFLSRMGLLRHSRPMVERLARKCNEALYIAVRRHDEVLFLDLVDTDQQVRIVSLLGHRYPLAVNAAGKIFLAHTLNKESLAQQKKISAGPALCPEERYRIRQQGYCIELNAFGEGVVEIAVPLFGSDGEVSGVLCMVGPDFRLTSEKIESECLPLLRETGEIISSKLGYLGHYINPRKNHDSADFAKS